MGRSCGECGAIESERCRGNAGAFCPIRNERLPRSDTPTPAASQGEAVAWCPRDKNGHLYVVDGYEVQFTDDDGQRLLSEATRADLADAILAATPERGND